LEAADAPSPQKLTFIPDGNGYYALQSADGQGYLSLTGQWNTSFTTDPSSAKALYAIENSGEFFVKLRCKYNNKYLGTDGTTASSAVYSDKDGTDTRHLWYLTTDVHQAPPADTSVYVINPAATRQQFEGWGISLCWWANMCGKWSDEKIDELVDWLVSPDGLDYRIFRYNIGGGDARKTGTARRTTWEAEKACVRKWKASKTVRTVNTFGAVMPHNGKSC
jgi:hypothetical protein